MRNVGSRIMNKVVRTMQKLCFPALNLIPSKVRLLLTLVNEMLEAGSLTFFHKLSSQCETEPRWLHPAVATWGSVLRVSFSLGLSWPPSAEVPCYPVMTKMQNRKENAVDPKSTPLRRWNHLLLLQTLVFPDWHCSNWRVSITQTQNVGHWLGDV